MVEIVPFVQTPLLVARLEGWLRIVEHYTIYYTELLQEVTRTEATFKHLQSRIALDPTKVEFARDSKLVDLLKIQLDYHQKLTLTKTKQAAFLKTQTVPALKSLSKEIHAYIKNFKEAALASLDKEIMHDQKDLGKLMKDFHASFSTQHETANRPDPWLANQKVKRHLMSCIFKQPIFREKLLEQQTRLQLFEEDILHQISIIQTSFLENESLLNVSVENANLYLSSTFSQIQRIQEDGGLVQEDFAKFKEMHREQIAHPEDPFLSFEEISYMGMSTEAARHPNTLEILHAGELLLKVDGKLDFFKAKNTIPSEKDKWRSAFGVLTGDGHLHCFEQGPEQSNTLENFFWYVDKNKGGFLHKRKEKMKRRAQHASVLSTNPSPIEAIRIDHPAYRDPIFSAYLPAFRAEKATMSFQAECDYYFISLTERKECKRNFFHPVEKYFLKGADADSNDFWFDLMQEKARGRNSILRKSVSVARTSDAPEKRFPGDAALRTLNEIPVNQPLAAQGDPLLKQPHDPSGEPDASPAVTEEYQDMFKVQDLWKVEE